MTESTDSINTLVDSISDRLNILELIVSPTTLDASVRVPADNPSATIVGGLKDAQSNLKKELQKQLSLASFIQLYDSMEPLFTTRQLMPGTLPRNISNSTLKEMVLAADADLTEMADHLSAIDSLKNLIDIPSLSELPRLQPQLSAVESDLNQDVDRITRMHNQFTTVLAEYNEFAKYGRVSAVFAISLYFGRARAKVDILQSLAYLGSHETYTCILPLSAKILHLCSEWMVTNVALNESPGGAKL